MSLAVGAKLPSVRLITGSLETVDLATFFDANPGVVLFYPASFTGVCEKELCSFRDSLGRYNDLGARVVGISVDTPFAQKAFAQKNDINFPLLSDFNKEAIRAFDIVIEDLKGLRGLAQRAVFVVDETGTVTWSWVADIPPQEPPYDEVAAAVQALSS